MNITKRIGATTLALVLISVALVSAIASWYAVQLVKKTELTELNNQYTQLIRSIDLDALRGKSMALEIAAMRSVT